MVNLFCDSTSVFRDSLFGNGSFGSLERVDIGVAITGVGECADLLQQGLAFLHARGMFGILLLEVRLAGVEEHITGLPELGPQAVLIARAGATDLFPLLLEGPQLVRRLAPFGAVLQFQGLVNEFLLPIPGLLVLVLEVIEVGLLPGEERIALLAELLPHPLVVLFGGEADRLPGALEFQDLIGQFVPLLGRSGLHGLHQFLDLFHERTFRGKVGLVLVASCAVVLVDLFVDRTCGGLEAVTDAFPFLLEHGPDLVPLLLVILHPVLQLLDVVVQHQPAHVADQGLLQTGVLPQVMVTELLVDPDVVEELVQELGVLLLQVAIGLTGDVADGLPFFLKVLEALEGGADVLLLGDHAAQLGHDRLFGREIVGLLLGPLPPHVVHLLVVGVEQLLETFVLLVQRGGGFDRNRRLGGGRFRRLRLVRPIFLRLVLTFLVLRSGDQGLVGILDRLDLLGPVLRFALLQQCFQTSDQFRLGNHTSVVRTLHSSPRPKIGGWGGTGKVRKRQP